MAETGSGPKLIRDDVRVLWHDLMATRVSQPGHVGAEASKLVDPALTHVDGRVRIVVAIREPDPFTGQVYGLHLGERNRGAKQRGPHEHLRPPNHERRGRVCAVAEPRGKNVADIDGVLGRCRADEFCKIRHRDVDGLLIERAVGIALKESVHPALEVHASRRQN